MVVFNYLDSDNILNRGAAANDNTGDTLRTAALKINVNFETVDSALGLMQTQITTNDSDIASLQSQITGNDSDITSLQSQITANDNDITSLQSQITSNDNDITSLQSQISANDSDILNLVVDSNGIGAGAVTSAKLDTNLTLGDVTVTGIATPSLNTNTTWDTSAKQTCSVTASGSTTVTLTNTSGLSVGTPLTLIVADASGASLTLAGPTFKNKDGTAPVLNGTAGETMIVSMVVIASNTIAVASVIVS
jgi:hypothetical protein